MLISLTVKHNDTIIPKQASRENRMQLIKTTEINEDISPIDSEISRESAAHISGGKDMRAMSDLDWRAPYVLTLLLIASRMDIRDRRVPNLLWLGFIPAINLSTPTTGPVKGSNTLQPAISVLMMASIALLFFGLGFFGGADMKAVISISYVFPFQVRPAFPQITGSVWLSLSTLINASLISTVISFASGTRSEAADRSGEGRPFLPLLTLGFISALALGDPFTIAVSHLLGIL